MELALEMDELYEKYKNDLDNYTYEKKQVYREIKVIGIFYRRYRNGGAERVISYLMPLFLKMGYRVILLTEEEPTSDDYILPEEVNRYTICNHYDIVCGKEKYEKRANELIRIINETNMDVFMYEDIDSPMAYWDSMLANKLGIYVIGHWHGMFSQPLLKFDWVIRRLDEIRMFDKLVVLSSAEVAFWKIYGIKSKYIYNPIEQIEAENDNKEKEYIVWISRLNDPVVKGFMDIFYIMKKVTEKYKNIKLYIYGKWELFDEKITRDIIKKFDLEDNIIMGGYKSCQEDIWRRARIHLVTSASESFPMMVCESKVRGIPLVTYDMPYLEILNEQKGYISVPYTDYDGAANAILSILDDEEMEKRLSVEARESLGCFTEKELINRWQCLLEELQSNNTFIEEEKHKKDILDCIGDCVDEMAIKRSKIIDIFHQLTYAKMLRKVKSAYLRKKKIVLYPYGQVGKYVEGILKENGIQVDYVIDENATSDSVAVKRFNDIKEEDLKDRLIVICNNKLAYWEEIRYNLDRYNKLAEVYDICPKEKMEKSVAEGLCIWW
ncbi:MAG: glycosyltransferase [Lachnospiraceae bacterium]|nr:glycosyltransferase [Lachnospiraceae bacterium]